MLDHPVTQKVLATVVAAGVLGTGTTLWKTTRLAERHDVEIMQLRKDETEHVAQYAKSIDTIVEKVDVIQKDVGDIKTGVEVLRARTEIADRYGKPRT